MAYSNLLSRMTAMSGLAMQCTEYAAISIPRTSSDPDLSPLTFHTTIIAMMTKERELSSSQREAVVHSSRREIRRDSVWDGLVVGEAGETADLERRMRLVGWRRRLRRRSTERRARWKGRTREDQEDGPSRRRTKSRVMRRRARNQVPTRTRDDWDLDRR